MHQPPSVALGQDHSGGTGQGPMVRSGGAGQGQIVHSAGTGEG